MNKSAVEGSEEQVWPGRRSDGVAALRRAGAAGEPVAGRRQAKLIGALNKEVLHLRAR